MFADFLFIALSSFGGKGLTFSSVIVDLSPCSHISFCLMYFVALLFGALMFTLFLYLIT